MTDPSFWQSIVDNKYTLPADHDPVALAHDLCDLLGSPDPDLRDGFAYTILAHWLIGKQFSPDQMSALIEKLLPNLKIRPGETGTDSVLLRSFSALMISQIINEDRKAPFLSAGMAHRILQAALEYLRDERDLRGYDPNRGWIHATAHTADILLMLSFSQHLAASDLQNILAGLADRVTARTGMLFMYYEEDRLARAAANILRRNLLDEAALIAWLEGRGRLADEESISLKLEMGLYSAAHNTRLFLRALYFHIAEADPVLPHGEALRERILPIVQKFPV
jgi:hypothetical protein